MPLLKKNNLIGLLFLFQFALAQNLKTIRIEKPDTAVFFYPLNSINAPLSPLTSFVFHVPKSQMRSIFFKVHNAYFTTSGSDTLVLNYRPGICFELFLDSVSSHSRFLWKCLINGTGSEPPESILIQCLDRQGVIFEERFNYRSKAVNTNTVK